MPQAPTPSPSSKKCPSFCWPRLHQFGRSMARIYQCLCVQSPADDWIPSIARICTCISSNHCRSHQHHACQEGVQRERGARQEHQTQQQHQQQQPAVLRQAAVKRQRTMQPPGAAMGPSIVTVVQCCHMIVCHGLLCISDNLLRLYSQMLVDQCSGGTGASPKISKAQHNPSFLFYMHSCF